MQKNGWETLLCNNFAWILKSQTKRLNLVNNEQSNVNFVREMNTYYMYMKGWYYMYKERSWPLVNKLSLGQRRDLVMPLGRILVVYTVCIRVHDIVWSGKGSCKSGCESRGKKWDWDWICILLFFPQGKGLNYVYEITTTENNEMVVHWDWCIVV